jgi:hypothetical protein
MYLSCLLSIRFRYTIQHTYNTVQEERHTYDIVTTREIPIPIPTHTTVDTIMFMFSNGGGGGGDLKGIVLVKEASLQILVAALVLTGGALFPEASAPPSSILGERCARVSNNGQRRPKRRREQRQPQPESSAFALKPSSEDEHGCRHRNCTDNAHVAQGHTTQSNTDIIIIPAVVEKVAVAQQQQHRQENNENEGESNPTRRSTLSSLCSEQHGKYFCENSNSSSDSSSSNNCSSSSSSSSSSNNCGSSISNRSSSSSTDSDSDSSASDDDGSSLPSAGENIELEPDELLLSFRAKELQETREGGLLPRETTKLEPQIKLRRTSQLHHKERCNKRHDEKTNNIDIAHDESSLIGTTVKNTPRTTPLPSIRGTSVVRQEEEQQQKQQQTLMIISSESAQFAGELDICTFSSSVVRRNPPPLDNDHGEQQDASIMSVKTNIIRNNTMKSVRLYLDDAGSVQEDVTVDVDADDNQSSMRQQEQLLILKQTPSSRSIAPVSVPLPSPSPSPCALAEMGGDGALNSKSMCTSSQGGNLLQSKCESVALSTRQAWRQRKQLQ